MFRFPFDSRVELSGRSANLPRRPTTKRYHRLRSLQRQTHRAFLEIVHVSRMIRVLVPHPILGWGTNPRGMSNHQQDQLSGRVSELWRTGFTGLTRCENEILLILSNPLHGSSSAASDRGLGRRVVGTCVSPSSAGSRFTALNRPQRAIGTGSHRRQGVVR